MSGPQTDLIQRLRGQLIDQPTTREVSMFGGRSFMINNKLIVSAQKDGALLVRVAAEQHARLMSLPGATQAEMGVGRSMGAGWISVAPRSLASNEDLAFWLGAALDYNHTVTSPS